MKILKHPAFSPNLSILDFGQFGTLKNSFCETQFEIEDELFEEIRNSLASKNEEFCESLVFEWKRKF